MKTKEMLIYDAACDAKLLQGPLTLYAVRR